MLLLVLAGVFFLSGWYLSSFVRAWVCFVLFLSSLFCPHLFASSYLEANVQSLFHRCFGSERPSALTDVKQECFCKKANCQRYMWVVADCLTRQELRRDVHVNLRNKVLLQKGQPCPQKAKNQGFKIILYFFNNAFLNLWHICRDARFYWAQYLKTTPFPKQ